MLVLQHQLNESQWFAPETLLARQLVQLEQVLDHAYGELPFYRERLESVGYAPGERLTAETWRSIPRLTRSEIQSQGEGLLSENLPQGHGRMGKVVTSGSSGTPMSAYGTTIAGFIWMAFCLRDHIWHGRDLSGRLAAIRPSSEDGSRDPKKGARSNVWGPAEQLVEAAGPASMLDLQFSMEQQAGWLVRQNPHYFLSYPTNILHLARYFMDKGLALPRLREVITVSEVLDPEVRLVSREAWGAKVTDAYSCKELGTLALQCPEHEHYHVQSEAVMLEVLDGERPCEPGEVGQVVATNLHNFAMPFIREDLGDFAEVGAPCSCGRGLPVLKRIMGRARNFVSLPTGEKYWPRFGFAQFDKVAPIRQFRFIQRTLEEIELQLVALREVTAEEEARLTEIIVARLRYPFKLTFTYLDEIPRSPGGKYEDFRSEVS
jgi:phenylacetate-CoA ligase